ncbi:Transcription factor MUTE [Linum grandiflorum]
MSHIAVERNRRRQMNENLKVLRSLTPRIYIKRGDQASIIGGVIDFIKELHQLLQALESKKQRRLSLSPSSGSSPSPRHHHMLQLMPPAAAASSDHHVKEETSESSSSQLGACCNSPVADVEAKLTGSNVELKVISSRVHGQVVRMITVLEMLSFEVLHLNISSMDDTVLYSFLLKIGLECRVSMEELALEVQRTFFSPSTTPTTATAVADLHDHHPHYPNELLCL